LTLRQNVTPSARRMVRQLSVLLGSPGKPINPVVEVSAAYGPITPSRWARRRCKATIVAACRTNF